MDPASNREGFVTGICLYQPTLNTAFQYSGEHQALRRGDVSADKLYPFRAAGVYKGIYDRACQHKSSVFFDSLKFPGSPSEMAKNAENSGINSIGK